MCLLVHAVSAQSTDNLIGLTSLAGSWKKQKFKFLKLFCDTRNAHFYDNFRRARNAFERLVCNESRQLEFTKHIKTKNTSGRL